jgi:hypothetical protein
MGYLGLEQICLTRAPSFIALSLYSAERMEEVELRRSLRQAPARRGWCDARQIAANQGTQVSAPTPFDLCKNRSSGNACDCSGRDRLPRLLGMIMRAELGDTVQCLSGKRANG